MGQVAPILKARLVVNLSSFLSTYKGANRNFGRKDRRKYAG